MKTHDLTLYRKSLQAILMRVRPAPFASFLKKLSRVERTVISTSEGLFWIDPVSVFGYEISRKGVYEASMLGTLDRFLAPGATFVDVGANEGYFSVAAAKRCGRSGRIIAVEPQQRLQPIIRENLRINEIEHVRIVTAAVTDAPGTAILSLSTDINSGSSGIYPEIESKRPREEVKAVTLAQLLQGEGIEDVDLMKMDIEGFEFEAVLGARSIFEQRKIKAIALELHPSVLLKRGKDIAEITRFLEGCGYSMSEEFLNTVWSL